MIKRNYELDAEAMANMQKEEGFDFNSSQAQHGSTSDGLNLSDRERAMQESYFLHQQN